MKATKPTILIVGYGANESWEGEAGLPRFREGMNRLLDALEGDRAAGDRAALADRAAESSDADRPLCRIPHNREVDRALCRGNRAGSPGERGHRYVDLAWRPTVSLDSGDRPAVGFEQDGPLPQPDRDPSHRPLRATASTSTSRGSEPSRPGSRPTLRRRPDAPMAEIAAGTRSPSARTALLHQRRGRHRPTGSASAFTRSTLLPPPDTPGLAWGMISVAGCPRGVIGSDATAGRSPRATAACTRQFNPACHLQAIDGRPAAGPTAGSRSSRAPSSWTTAPTVEQFEALRRAIDRQEPPLFPPLAPAERDVPVRLPQARAGQQRRRGRAIRPARRRGRGRDRPPEGPEAARV